MAGFADDGKGIEGPGGLRAWWIWGAAALFYLYEFFVRAAPAVMEPQLQEAFHLSAAAIGGVLGVYFYIYAPMQLLVGPALDRFSAKGVLAPAALFCAVGCFLEVAGDAAFLLGLARFCQGFGSAFAFVGTMYLAAQWFPRRRLALLSGLTTSLGMIGAIIGNAGIAQAVEELGWNVTLRDAGFFGIFVAALIFIIVPSKPPRPQAKEPEEKGALRQAASGLKIVMLNRQTWLVSIVATALFLPVSVIGGLWGVRYIEALTGETPVRSAIAVSMIYVGWLIGGPFAGWLSDYIGHRRLLLAASAGLTVAVTGLLLIFSQMALWEICVLMFLVGLCSSPQVISFVVAVEHNPHKQSGTAIAVTNMIVMLFNGIAMWLFGVILQVATGSGDFEPKANYSIDAYRWAMAMLPLSALVGALAAYILEESIDKNKDPEDA